MPEADAVSSWSLLELREALLERRLSAPELMEHVLARVASTHARLNAIVALRDADALRAEARAAQARIDRGAARALEGIPLGVKDLEDAAGLPTTRGSRLFADHRPERDEVHVERLRAAGAIVVGKTNTPEFGLTALTYNLLFGVTRSPWDLERTPGGSSGGSAAALVAGVLPLVTASDGGGSIRLPAAWSGAFGLKPSYGRIPRGPASAWDTTHRTVYGPLTKTVADAAYLLDLMAGPSLHDPTSLPHPGLRYLDLLDQEPPRGWRIGYATHLGRWPVDPEILAAVEDVVRAVERAGHTLVPVEVELPDAVEDWLLTDAWELAGSLADRLAGREDQIARWILEWIERVRTLTPERFVQAQRRRNQIHHLLAPIFADVDLLITPTTAYTAPPASGPFPDRVAGRPIAHDAAGVFTMPFNLSLQPAASLRVGLSGAGLPIGMQIVGRPHREDQVLALCRVVERERPWHPYWPVLEDAPAS